MLGLPFSVYSIYVCLCHHSFPWDCLQTSDQILKSNWAGHTSEKNVGIAYLAVSEDQALSKTTQVKNLKAKRSRILKCWTETRQARLCKKPWYIKVRR